MLYEANEDIYSNFDFIIFEKFTFARNETQYITMGFYKEQKSFR